MDSSSVDLFTLCKLHILTHESRAETIFYRLVALVPMEKEVADRYTICKLHLENSPN